MLGVSSPLDSFVVAESSVLSQCNLENSIDRKLDLSCRANFELRWNDLNSNLFDDEHFVSELIVPV